MDAVSIWSSDTKFIEFGLRTRAIASGLKCQGFHRYLGIGKDSEHVSALAADAPDLAGRLVAVADRKAVRRNNADVLILSGWAAWHALRFRNLRHAESVAWLAKPTPTCVLAFVACFVHFLLRRLGGPQLVTCPSSEGRSLRMFVFPVRRRKPQDCARYYVPHAPGVGGFLRRLDQAQVGYLILRWFETLPMVPAGEDLDMLVEDDQLDVVRGILNEEPGIQPCDLYSVTGLPGSDYRSIPYFPPYVSEALLRDAVDYRGVCQVPSREHHFRSLAFHALYHKGLDSGLPSRNTTRKSKRSPEHDYASILATLAARIGVQVPITYEDLDEYLDSQGWRPPHDMLVRLSKRNVWLRRQLGRRDTNADDAGLAVFVIRKEAMKRGGMPRALSVLERHGFSVLASKVLSEREMALVAKCIRGGNWGRGPWKVSAGPPAAVVAAYDTEPIRPTWFQKRRFPFLQNARLLSKKHIRRCFNQGYPEEEHCNVIHSSDNGGEAADYLRIAMPEMAEEIKQHILDLKRAIATDEPVLRTLTRFGRRAKIEMFEQNGVFVVKKTFKPNQKRFCRREAAALRELSRTIKEVPPLLSTDGLSLTMPYYENIFRYKRSSGKMLPIPIARQAMDVVKRIHEEGYAILDASIDNLLIDRNEGLKLIDFEFAHKYDQRPESFEESYDIAGCPGGFAGDVPLGGERTYRQHWQLYVGLSLHSLFHDPRWLQHVKRTVHYVTHVHRFVPRLLRHYYRNIASLVPLMLHRLRSDRNTKLPNSVVTPQPTRSGDSSDGAILPRAAQRDLAESRESPLADRGGPRDPHHAHGPRRRRAA